MPFRRTSLNGTRTRFSRFVQYGLISRYSTRLRPATIFANHFRSRVVVMTSNLSPVRRVQPPIWNVQRGAVGCRAHRGRRALL